MDKLHEISLKLPASAEDALVARMALSGLGVLAGLDADLVGDLRTVTNECCDCLIHQSVLPLYLQIDANVTNGRLSVTFSAQGNGGTGPKEALDMDVVRGVLETLMPEVKLMTDQRGVYGILCSMPV